MRPLPLVGLREDRCGAVSGFRAVLEQVLDAVAREETPSLRAAARARNWDARVANSLKLIRQGSKVVPWYSPLVADDVEAYEYGTPSANPVPVLFLYSSQTDLGPTALKHSGPLVEAIDRMF